MTLFKMDTILRFQAPVHKVYNISFIYKQLVTEVKLKKVQLLQSMLSFNAKKKLFQLIKLSLMANSG